MYYPTKPQFIKLAKQGNLIPVYRDIFADLETPVSAFLKLSQGREYAYLLESVEGEEKVARFSFLAVEPRLIFESKGKEITITDLSSGSAKTRRFTSDEDPLFEIKKLMAGFKAVPVAGLPRFFGGLVGYMGYDTVRFFEDLPDKNPDELKVPDTLFMLSDLLVVFDHLNHRLRVVCCALIDRKTGPAVAYEQAIKKIDRLVRILAKPLAVAELEPPAEGARSRRLQPAIGGQPTRNIPPPASNFSKPAFTQAVRRAKAYIRKGDIIQVVLSQRFKLVLKSSPFSAYRLLRTINPSPYMFYLKFKDLHIVGSSPEVMVRCEDKLVETRPIAGTRSRGKDEAEDRALEKSLLSDIKEKAEHIMLVDLGRNDLGRVCTPGSVKVTEFMTIERYSHVMHIVSNVQGRLARDKDIYDVVAATFPAGTVAGAPKVRAMEIIEELENTRRGIYAGSVGYFGFSGNLDTCIAIRTIVIKGKRAYVQAGAGIVQDSQPAKEYAESFNKAKAQIMALSQLENKASLHR